MSWSRPASRRTGSGSSRSTTAKVCRRTSLWRCTGSCSSCNADSSGRNSSASPVSTRNSSPAPGDSPTSSLSSSSRTRSADTMARRSRIRAIASSRRDAGVIPSCETKRAARSIRNGSSENAISGSNGVSSRFAARSFTPSKGSTNSPSGSRTAIALIVKSRRERSVRMSFAKVTAGLRSSTGYRSSRKVVISSTRPCRRAPTVPKRTPTRYWASVQPRRSRDVSAGEASVAKSASVSGASRPITMSRTTPPTRYSSCPAAWKRSPSSFDNGSISSVVNVCSPYPPDFAAQGAVRCSRAHLARVRLDAAEHAARHDPGRLHLPEAARATWSDPLRPAPSRADEADATTGTDRDDGRIRGPLGDTARGAAARARATARAPVHGLGAAVHPGVLPARDPIRLPPTSHGARGDPRGGRLELDGKAVAGGRGLVEGRSPLERAVEGEVEVVRVGRRPASFVRRDDAFLHELHERLVEGLHPVELTTGDHLEDACGLVRVHDPVEHAARVHQDLHHRHAALARSEER